MPLSKIQFKPGIDKEGTIYSNEGGYYSCDKIRFRSGYPEKIGGWINYSYSYTYKGISRAMFNWVTYDSYNLLALGTNERYYVEQGGFYNDITPIRSGPTTLGASPIATTNGSKLVTITATGHGASMNSWVNITTTAAVNGLTLNGYYEIVSVPDANTFTIASIAECLGTISNASGTPTLNVTSVTNGCFYVGQTIYGLGIASGTTITALGTGTGGTGTYTVSISQNVQSTTIYATRAATGTGTGGGTVNVTYLLNSGSSTVTTAVGWGSGGWGSGGWGMSTGTVGTTVPLRLWSQDLFEQDLIFSPVGGDIYYWTKDTTTYARAVTLQSKCNSTTKILTATTTYSNPGATSITIANTDGINTGSVISGFDIPSSTYVTTAWNYSTTLTLSNALTSISATATIAGGTSLTVTAGGTGMAAGMIVTGSGIPAGTSITGTFPNFTLSAASTNAVGVAITAGGIKSGETITVGFAGRHAPNKTNYVIASDTSHFTIALGSKPYDPTNFDPTFDPMLVRWSDQENPFDWVPDVANQSGEQHLSNGSYLVAAQNARQEILVWSDVALFSMQYLGPPYVWGFNLIGDNTSIASANAAIAVNTVTYWMGVDKFYSYNGRLETLSCTIWKFVYDNINRSQLSQVVCGSNEGFSEIWWHYPSRNSTINDSYVIYNYLENTWYYGTMNRSAWLDSPLRSNPMACFSLQNSFLNADVTSTQDTITLVDSGSYPTAGTVYIESEQITYTGNSNNTLTGCIRGANSTTAATHLKYTSAVYYVPNQVMFHEYGVDDQSCTTTAPIAAYLESSDFDIGDGNNFSFVWRVVPDLTFRNSTAESPRVMLSLKARLNSGSAYTTAFTDPTNVTRTATVPVEQYTGQVYTRIRGRQMAFRVESVDLGVAWQVGAMRIDLRQDGRR